MKMASSPKYKKLKLFNNRKAFIKKMIPRLFYRLDGFNLAIVTLMTDFEKKFLWSIQPKSDSCWKIVTLPFYKWMKMIKLTLNVNVEGCMGVIDQDTKVVQELQELKQKVSHLEDLLTEQANKKEKPGVVRTFLDAVVSLLFGLFIVGPVAVVVIGVLMVAASWLGLDSW